jgi:hypothetical protein
MKQFSDPFSTSGSRQDGQMASRGNTSGSSSATLQSGSAGSSQGNTGMGDAGRPNNATPQQPGARPATPGRTS